MDPTELWRLSATEAAGLIRAGTIESGELVAACLERVARVEPGVLAWTFLDPDHALTQARAADEWRRSGRPLGALHGVPVALKDIIDTADMPTENGSVLHAGRTPSRDAAVTERLRAAGAILMGKTVTTEFATRTPGKTRNPHHPGHTPGGSSSGSAAAVGAGMIPLALGTQTGGSVIRPASFCGVAAIKPTYRLLPTIGVKCFSWTLDTVGLFAAGVGDLAHGLSAMTGRPELLPGGAMPAPRIGIVTQDFAGDPEATGAEALEIARRAAERAGASVRALKLPDIVAEAWRIHPTVQDFEAQLAFAWEYRENYDAMPPLLRGRLDESKGTTAAEYDAARRVGDQARAALAAVFNEVDVLLTLSAPGAAPKGLDSTGDPRFNRLWTLMGVPCVNVPAYVADGGLPVGVQVIARFGADAEALAAARFVEEALANR